MLNLGKDGVGSSILLGGTKNFYSLDLEIFFKGYILPTDRLYK